MSPALRAPVWPSRDPHGLVLQRNLAAIGSGLAQQQGGARGRIDLVRWCISSTSMSKSSPSAAAAFLTSAASRLTPSEKLPVLTMAVCAACLADHIIACHVDAGGADDVDFLLCRRQRHQRQRGLGNGEIDDAVTRRPARHQARR